MVNGSTAAQPDEQSSGRVDPSAPHKLSWKWIPAHIAANAALDQHPEMEALRKGQDLFTVSQFANALEDKAQEILMTSYGFALIEWAETADGKTMNIVTVTTDMPVADIGIHEIEAAAYERGAKMIITVGRLGWEDFLTRHGYTVERSVIARKVLNEYSIS